MNTQKYQWMNMEKVVWLSGVVIWDWVLLIDQLRGDLSACWCIRLICAPPPLQFHDDRWRGRVTENGKTLSVGPHIHLSPYSHNVIPQTHIQWNIMLHVILWHIPIWSHEDFVSGSRGDHEYIIRVESKMAVTDCRGLHFLLLLQRGAAFKQ